MSTPIQIDLNRLTYQEYRAFVAEGAAADEIGLLCKVVTGWGWAGDPADRASYERLGMLDFLAVQHALREAIRQATGASDQGN